ncbi:right-handed parallel beta-helix repeat-containing protein [Gottfriedia luciferensis]|uniref:right-handed parallel beta-helix repeat-containing protein n=1 Tax=Gottfriedia luciferensis TaxID=178774 RepID=UPI000B437E12|nr:right-handed parallel beta-helix repeat-containing protein [Gottfriedia luciferensis]
MAISNPVINKLLTVTSLNVNSYPVSGSGVANGTVYLTFKDSNSKTVSTTVKANSSGSFSTKLNLSSLKDGQLSFEAYQKDTKGNTSGKTKLSVLKDTIGPSILFSVTNVTIQNQSAYQVNGKVEANQKVSLTVSDGTHSLSKDTTADSSGNFSATFNVSTFNDGNITIKAVSRDAYGNSSTNSTVVKKDTTIVTPPGTIYELTSSERTRWGIYNDGTHPIETTNGFNSALQWAQANGYSTFHVLGGTYLIAKGIEDRDNNAQINMVSNMTFLMDTDTVIQKETNKWEQYAVISLGREIINVAIKGGTLKGDRTTHDYTYVGPYTTGTHEWGFGILSEGALNVTIDGVKFSDFTGDGIQAGGTTITGVSIDSTNLELGGLDANGNPISQTGKIRTKQIALSDPAYQNPHYRNIMMWNPDGLNGKYDLYYYRNDGSLIKVDKDQDFNSSFGYSKIPDEAVSWRAVFNASSTANVGVQMMTVAVTENLLIQNCDIGNNRRQGISLVGTDGVKILNNKIHDIGGIAPGSGVDLEPGFYPGINTEISNNQFLNNKIHLVLAYGGHAIANNNYFGPGASFASTSWGGVSASNNNFDGSTFVSSDGSSNVTFVNNKFTSGGAVFDSGENIVIDGFIGIDSDISFTQTVVNGINASNLSFTSSGQDTELHGFAIWGDKPLTINNINIEGNNAIAGTGLASNVYSNVTFTNPVESRLAAGTYNNPVITNGNLNFSTGKVTINQGQFKNATFVLDNDNGYPDVSISNSTFNFDKAVPGNIILVNNATNFAFLNNTINDSVTITADHPIIQIGRDAWKNSPSQVKGATINGNKLTSKVKRVGIDTTNGGTGAPPYDVENNTLINNTLALTSKDINKNNTVS